jgi:hypothetical protein
VFNQLERTALTTHNALQIFVLIINVSPVLQMAIALLTYAKTEFVLLVLQIHNAAEQPTIA